MADQMLGWTTAQVAEIETAAATLYSRQPITEQQRTALQDARLLDPQGSLNALGKVAGYNSAELLWQAQYDPLESLCDQPALTDATRVIDLGGGSGQTLRRLFPQPRGAFFVVDIDLAALAWGSRLFDLHDIDATFCCASAERLPFATDYFDFVVCRGVIMYTMQQQTIREIFRVLRPGGQVFFRVESYRWDLYAMTRTRNPLKLGMLARSFLLGSVHAVTGVQPAPGRGWFFGPRAFVTRSRFESMVTSAGGQVVKYESSRRGPQFMGAGTQDVALCVKL
jgi:ubiquinone/menaquinone biosynthesis C-methylase UbiE